jgi:glycosyltransferase involved in cell wall biosynthesis
VRILVLVSKCPWPLTDGAAIRDFNLLKETAARHEVSLLCFLSKPTDREHLEALRPYCKRITGIDLVRPRWRALLNAGKSLVTSQPFIVAEYWRPEMAAALEREDVDVVHSHFLHMSQYVGRQRRAAFVHDAHNLEHVLWQRLAATLDNPLRRAFARSQARSLIGLQQRVARASDKCVTLSDEDRAEYLRICPDADVATVPNGADVEYWTPREHAGEPNTILYFGNLGWPPQADAAIHFHDKLLPRIPNARFVIAGQNPPESLRRLESDRVTVTGSVPDMRDWVAKATVVVMPLRVGAGTKHRVFQALAMKKPVVCTPVAAEGIALTHGETAMLADTDEAFVDATRALLRDPGLRERLGERGRRLVLDRYDWRQIYEKLEQAFQDAAAKRRGRLAT